MGPARSLMGSPQAQTEGGQGPSSKIRSPKWPEDTAEDSLVLGRPQGLIDESGVQAKGERSENISGKLSLIPFIDKTLHLTEPDF